MRIHSQKIVVYFIIINLHFFLLPMPTASSFLITSLSGWGGGMNMAGGGMHMGGGGMHVHPVHPPWVFPWW
jgi:hypothetical protein